MNNELIDRAHNIIKSLSDKDKRIILSCISNYRRIFNIDYQEKINTIYKKYNIYEASSKISLEKERINYYLADNDNDSLNNIDIKNSYMFIMENINLLSKVKTSYSKNQKETQILTAIIELEIKLGMSIILFDEFKDYFESKILEYEEVYQKKRD